MIFYMCHRRLRAEHNLGLLIPFRVNVARNVDFFGVVHSAVAVAFLIEVVVHAVLVRVNGGFRRDLFLDVRHDCGTFGVPDSTSDYTPLRSTMPKTGVL